MIPIAGMASGTRHRKTTVRSRAQRHHARLALRRTGAAADDAGGRVYSRGVGPKPDAHPGKMLDMMMLVGPGGQERTEAEYGYLLGKAGFHLTRVVPTNSQVGVIEAVSV